MQKISAFTLLEVMISMFLLSIALLGMDVMAVKSLQQTRQTYFLSVTENESQNMRERSWNIQKA